MRSRHRAQDSRFLPRPHPVPSSPPEKHWCHSPVPTPSTAVSTAERLISTGKPALFHDSSTLIHSSDRTAIKGTVL